MKHSTIYKALLAIVPLLLFGTYFIFIAGNPGGETDSAFIHPPFGGNPSPTSGMLRTQPSTAGALATTAAPSSDNVADSYFHEIFVFESKIKEAPGDTLSMRQLGRLLQDGHRMDEAVVYYTSYLNARPRAKQVWLDLAASFASDKKWIEAEESIGEMLQVYPGDESGRYNLGAIAANAGDLLKARQIWSEISENGAESAVKAMAKLSLARLN